MTIDIPGWWLWLVAGCFLMSWAVNMLLPGKERRWRRFLLAMLLEAAVFCIALAARGAA